MLRSSRQLIALVLFLLLGTVLLSASGCSGRPRRVPVSGQVLIDGKPVTAGFIRVIPDDARAAWAEIGPDGRFTLSTFGRQDGCVPGSHRVTVSAFDQSGGGLRWLAPQRYCDPKKSDLWVRIDGPTDSLVIELTWQGDEGPRDVPLDTAGDIDPAAVE